MFSLQVHKRIHFVLSCVIAFTLVFKLAAPMLVILLLANWLLEGHFAEKFANIKYPVVFYAFVVFYGLHLVSLLWSSNMEAGLFKLGVKLPLLVCPLLFATRPFTQKEIDCILSCYLFGCVAACVTLLIRALILSYHTDSNYFFYTRLSWFLHTGYLAMYLNLALAYMLLSFLPRQKLWWLVGLLLIATIVLLSSKIGYISLLFILGLWLGQMSFRQKKYLAALVGIALIFLISFGIWRYSPFVSSRFEHAIASLAGKNTDKKSAESTAVRLFMWKAALGLAHTSPLLGTGIGAEQEALMEAYRQEGIQRAIDLKLNAHNTYLQTLVSLGYTGLLLFLVVLALPLFIAARQKHTMYIVFLVLVIINFIPESLLEAQAGSMFFGFFHSVLFFGESTGLVQPQRSFHETMEQNVKQFIGISTVNYKN